MRRTEDSRAWIVAGSLGAILLGAALIPLRTVTSASNLAFVFLAFTILISELGGRSAALVTALVSAMSLNFFLTEPYLTLVISKREDIIAFIALVACGLIAAAFGKRRRHLSEVAGRAAMEVDILKKLVRQLGEKHSLEQILSELQNRFRLKAMVFRNPEGKLLAATPGASENPTPEMQLSPETLIPIHENKLILGFKGPRLPKNGGRLGLQTNRGVFSLDLWEGDAQGFSPDESRTLTTAASILAWEISRR